MKHYLSGIAHAYTRDYCSTKKQTTRMLGVFLREHKAYSLVDHLWSLPCHERTLAPDAVYAGAGASGVDWVRINLKSFWGFSRRGDPYTLTRALRRGATQRPKPSGANSLCKFLFQSAILSVGCSLCFLGSSLICFRELRLYDNTPNEPGFREEIERMTRNEVLDAPVSAFAGGQTDDTY
jgi:hypothetical protein